MSFSGVVLSTYMPQFRYVARNTEGKLIDGVVTCNDRAAVIRQVEQQRCVPIKIEAIDAPGEKPAPVQKASAVAKSGKGGKSSPASAETDASSSKATLSPVTSMSHAQQYLFTEQLGHLLAAGMTLDEALGILVRRMKHPRLMALSKALHQALVDGRSLSQALRDYPNIFSPLYVNMVSAGEASGALSDILKRLVKHLSDVKALRDRVQQALIYPAILVVAGIGLIILFITVMVPKLIGFFKGSSIQLPPVTMLLINADHFIVSYWWVMLLALGGLYAGFKAFTRTPDGRKAWDTFIWKVPVYSLITQYRFFAQFARTLGTLMENGVTLLKALELLEEISGNEYVRVRMVSARAAVLDGANLSKALGEQHLFPELFIDMMAVGEQTGRFSLTMQNIADMYERELDKQVKITSELIPPIIMMVIASVVGLVVYGILTAVFSLSQSLNVQPH